MTRLVKLFQGALAIITAIFFFGFGIDTLVGMPDYAGVYLDDEAKTFISLPCIDEWRSRPGADFAIARLSKASEARALRYKLDYDCREAGGYTDIGSLSGLLLERLGVLSPKQHWWDMPYRTEEGLVQPGRP